MSTEQLVRRHADQVEQMRGTGAIFAITIGSCEPHQRALLLRHHIKVIDELRRRGCNVKANVIDDEIEGEVVTIRVVDQASWSLVEEF